MNNYLLATTVAMVLYLSTCTARSVKCDRNEYYTSCGSSCPATCDNLEPMACDRMCNSGCYCKSGYVRLEKGGVCIPKDYCPATTTTTQSTTTTTGSYKYDAAEAYLALYDAERLKDDSAYVDWLYFYNLF